MAGVKWDSQPLDAWTKAHAKGKTIDLDGKRTHYLERGEGEPLILLHGFFYDSFMWASNIDALAKHFHVYALDLWGFGYSTRTLMDYSYALYAQQVLAFMDKLGIRQASLIGQSMGGGVVIKLAVDHPDRVNKLVLVDAAGMPNKLPFSGKLIKAFPAVGRFMYGLNTDAIRKQGLADYFVFDKAMLTQTYFDDVTRFHKIEGTIDVFASILQRDFFYTLRDEIEQLGRIGKRVLIVWGKEDKGNPLELGYGMHTLLSGSKLVVMENTRHVPNSEQPEEFNRHTVSFLCSDT
jgi:pimeloyl-ACP methyl ester carboxylesterase